MKALLKSMALVCVLLGSVSAFASGTLKLTVVAGSQTEVLTISNTGDDYTGSYSLNGGFPQGILAFKTPTQFVINIASSSSAFDLTSTEDSTIYNGHFSGVTSNIEATYKHNKIVYDGQVRSFTDFGGRADSNSLALFWGRSKLDLKMTTAGNCYGEVRANGVITHKVSCETTGDLLDIFFQQTDPAKQLKSSDNVVAWLANLLAK
jgi:hypothetical protein